MRRRKSGSGNTSEASTKTPSGELGVETKKGRGSTTWAKGKKLEFLLSLHGMFLENRGNMYTFATQEFLSRWGYDLHEDDEPLPGVDYTPVDLSKVPEDEREKEAEKRQRAYARLRDKIANWARYRWTRQRKAASKDVDSLMLTMLDLSATAPRKKKKIQYYQNKYYETRVQPDFNAHWETIRDNVPDNQRLAESNAFTEQKWQKETEEIRREVKDAVEEDYKAQLDTWEKRKDWDGDALSLEQAWSKSDDIVYLVADALSKIHGAGVSIFLWGPRAHGKIETSGIHSYPESASRRPLNEYNEDAYGGFVGLLRTYAKTVFSTEYIQSRIIDKDVSPSAGKDMDDDSVDAATSTAPGLEVSQGQDQDTDVGPSDSTSVLQGLVNESEKSDTHPVADKPSDLAKSDSASDKLHKNPSTLPPDHAVPGCEPSAQPNSPLPSISSSHISPSQFPGFSTQPQPLDGHLTSNAIERRVEPWDMNAGLLSGNAMGGPGQGEFWGTNGGNLLSFDNNISNDRFGDQYLGPCFFGGSGFGGDGFTGSFGGNSCMQADVNDIPPGGYMNNGQMISGYTQMTMGFPPYNALSSPQLQDHPVATQPQMHNPLTTEDSIHGPTPTDRLPMTSLPPVATQSPEKPVAPGKENTTKRKRASATQAAPVRASKRSKFTKAPDGSPNTVDTGAVNGSGDGIDNDPGNKPRRSNKAPLRVPTTVVVPIELPKKKKVTKKKK